MRRRITDVERVAVLAEYSVSQSVTKAAAAAGVGRTSAHRALKLGEIVTTTGLSLATVSTYLREEGLTAGRSRSAAR